MPARPARSGGAAGKAATARRGGDRSGRARSGGGRPAAAGNRARRSDAAAAAPAESLVVGPVPRVARAVGVLLVLSGLATAAGAFPTYLVVGGEALTQATGLGTALVALLVPAVTVAVGAVLARGAVPKLGLAYAGVSGALAVGQLLIELYRGSSSTDRPGVEVLAGARVLTTGVAVGPGWVLDLIGLGLAVLAGVGAAVAWGRTVMEDGGTLDPVRPGLAGAAALLGVGTVLCLALPAADVPDRIVSDPATGMQTVVAREGPQALLERPGLALLGGLLLAGAVVLCSVLAPSLRPRLAVVGGLLALAVAVLAAGLGGLRDAVSSDELDWTLPGAGLLLAGLAYALLTGLAWQLRRGAAAPPDPSRS